MKKGQPKTRHLTIGEIEQIFDLSFKIRQSAEQLFKIAHTEAQRALLDGYVHTKEGRNLHSGFLKIYRGAGSCISVAQELKNKPYFEDEGEE